MVGNYFTLQALTAEANQLLTGTRIAEAFTQDRAELVLTFDPPLPSVLFSCRTEGATFYLHPAFRRARKNSANLLRGIWGREIASVSLHPADRIVRISLKEGEAVVAPLFGPSANVLHLDNGGVILDAFLKGDDLIGKEFRNPSGEQVFDLRALDRLPSALAGLTALAGLRKLFPPLAQPLVEELLFRSGVEPATAAGDLGADAVRSVSTALQQIIVDLQHPLPRVYIDEESHRMILSIISLSNLQAWQERPFPTVHEAVRWVVTRRRADKSLDERRSTIAHHIRSSVERAKRTLDAVRNDGAKATRAEEYERFGTLLISAGGGSVRRGETLVPILHEGRHIEIPVDPRLSVIQNAQRYFEKAKRARGTLAQTGERATDLEDRITEGETLLAALDQASTPEELKRIMTERAESLATFGIGEKGVADPSPFRRFVVDGGFEVLAGKSSENNDELTLHHAKPQDLWFHARGSSGSHVVLRVSTGKGQPGKKAREQAAAIAAYYSKMKTAGLVPVAMTERKYVRKPKGAKPGSVILEREKVLFVRPALPQESYGK
jgi:predicted ribosome quality control (RQC) complex YloA/Tae2 family protein